MTVITRKEGDKASETRRKTHLREGSVGGNGAGDISLFVSLYVKMSLRVKIPSFLLFININRNERHERLRRPYPRGAVPASTEAKRDAAFTGSTESRTSHVCH